MIGVPKPTLHGIGVYTPPEPTLLTKKSKLNDYVYWTIGIEKRTGILITWKDNLAIIDTIEPPRKRISIETGE